MEKSNLTPYCINIASEDLKKIKKNAGARMTSAFIRDAVSAALDNNDGFTSGYNKGIRDACEMVKSLQPLSGWSLHGEPISDMICDRLEGMEK